MSGVLMIVAGLALLVATWAAWTGRWRGWAAWAGPPFYNFPITWMPGFGIFLVGGGLHELGVSDAVALPPAALGLFGGPLLFFFAPRKWWGPRWYRERKPTTILLGNPRAADAVSTVIEGTATGGRGLRRRLVALWQATRVDDGRAVRGHLALYPTAIAFQDGEGREGYAVIRQSDLRDVRVEGDELVLDAGRSSVMRVHVRAPERRARKIAATLRPGGAHAGARRSAATDANRLQPL